MSEVKRYDAVHLRYEDSNIRYGDGCEVEVVAAYDYARLEQECERLQLENESLAIGLRGKHSLVGATYARITEQRDAALKQVKGLRVLLARCRAYLDPHRDAALWSDVCAALGPKP